MIKKIIDLLCLIKDKAERILSNVLEIIIPTLKNHTETLENHTTKLDEILEKLDDLESDNIIVNSNIILVRNENGEAQFINVVSTIDKTTNSITSNTFTTLDNQPYTTPIVPYVCEEYVDTFNDDIPVEP